MILISVEPDSGACEGEPGGQYRHSDEKVVESESKRGDGHYAYSQMARSFASAEKEHFVLDVLTVAESKVCHPCEGHSS